MKLQTFFITGAEGAGKTSIIPYVKKAFPKMAVHDFDELGVPENPPLQWRLDTTLYWLKEALKNQKRSKSTCIVGLCFPSEVEKYEEHKKLESLYYCLLDLGDKARKKRLHKRNTPEMASYNTIRELRKEFAKKKNNKKVLNTSNLSIKETAERVNGWMRK